MPYGNGRCNTTLSYKCHQAMMINGSESLANMWKSDGAVD